jgi:hypothetical protein
MPGQFFISSVPFEVLDLSLVLFGRLSRLERAEISAAASLGVLLSRVETVRA